MPPTILINSLEHVRRRVKVLSVVHGIGIAAAAAMGLLLGTILIDYICNLPATARLVIILGSLAMLVYVLMRWIAKPMAARMSLSDVAGRLELAFPQFNDRLRSTIDFVESDNPGSEAMKRRVVGEAEEMASRFNLDNAVVARPAIYSIAGGVGAILLMISLALLTPNYAAIAISRLLTPFSAAAWPKRVQIKLTDDVPTRAAVGQRIDVRMKLVRGDSESRKASIFYQYDGGPVQREYMMRGNDGAYATSLDAQVESGKQASMLHVWMEAGDDHMDLSPITVVPRLNIKSVQAQITPPAYVTSQKASTADLSAGPAMAVEGSRVVLSVDFNKPLAKDAGVDLLAASEEMHKPTIEWQQMQNSVSGSWIARQSLRFRIRATDDDNFTNNALEEYEILVRPDQTPTVQIENPRRNEERTAVSIVPLLGTAEDDYGIDWLKLIVERQSDKKQWSINLLDNNSPSSGATVTRAADVADRLRLSVGYQWDLSQLPDAKLKPGDVLEYYLLVKDNFNLDGQTHPPVPSGRLRIAIITQEELTDRVVDELRQIKNKIAGVKSTVDRTHDETAGLADETKNKDQLDAADRAALDRLTTQQATSASQTKQIAAKVDSLRDRLNENKSPSQDLSDTTRDVAAALNQVAENPMKEATNQLSSANQPNAKSDQRGDALAKAADNQQQADQQLQAALDRMQSIGSLQQTIDKLKDILTQQEKISAETRDIGKQNLGKTPDQMSAADQQRLKNNADSQQKLGDQTAKAMDEMSKMSEQMSQSDPSSSDAMKKAADAGKQQQVSQNQQKAAEQARENQQAEAQAAQKQAELGLEVMLDQLREAERHKLAELQKKLEELQGQIANLIRRQAGHNLDDVALQGPEKLAKMDVAVIGDLLREAEREQGHLPPVPVIGQLSSGQEQTEQNTRDIGSSAEQTSNGAEPASHLTKAADRMERAIVNLHDVKLADAYDPSQVEALSELEQARKIIDEQKAKVDQQIQNQQKEAVRQRYMKIRDDQQKLDDETARIETSRAADGSLNRADTVRLGQLPGEQGKLADSTNDISQDLVAVGSSVYVWANKDIVQSMSEVKDDLGQQTTDAATQSEQQRIVDQLDAMIRNLAIKPSESKFAQDSDGSGGGDGQSNGGPQLPTEAELRLLQDLQKAVNKSTATIDALPTKDKVKLLSLGNRQGELRNLLDQTLQKASKGKIKLGAEPDNRDQLPEEAKAEDVDNQELEKNLLNDVPDEQKNDKEATLIGDRMARSRQRLALNDDPGKITQIIQQRIITDMDYLIDQARKQQAETRNSKSKSQQQQMAQAKPSEAACNNPGQQPKPNTAAKPAQQSRQPGAAQVNSDLSKEIRESAAEWGSVTPRMRDAVIEGSGENVVEEYRKFVEDYYRSVANQGAGQQNQ